MRSPVAGLIAKRSSGMPVFSRVASWRSISVFFWACSRYAAKAFCTSGVEPAASSAASSESGATTMKVTP
jgi:hypothetical protein